jgi:5-(carboxyamino)imidazole ribonucleotide synthase
MIVGPGSTIGIIGGGQLGRMLAVAAAQLGYKCHILDPNPIAAAAQVSAHFTCAAYDDLGALREMADSVVVATYEFENLPVGPLEVLGDKLNPSTRSLEIAQDRAREKAFIEECGGRVAPWREISAIDGVNSAVAELGCPIVLKTRRWGYDGKGQAWVRADDETANAWSAIGEEAAIAEAAIPFDCEFSIVLARGADGSIATWDPPLNDHDNGILRRSTVPAPEIVERHRDEAVRVATAIAEGLGHIGVLTVEFFACAGGPIVNEIAPRVHNSGHWTIEGAVTSQFEQHIRAICGLPLGSTARVGSSAMMENLLGEEIAGWPGLVAQPGTHVHIYGKGEARPGRKMGHFTRVTP